MLNITRHQSLPHQLLVHRCLLCLFGAISVSFFSCNNKKEKESALFQLVENTGISFQNNVEDGSKDNSFVFRNFYNGGGVAMGDINNDGLSDVFLTSNSGGNKLYLNKGNFQFKDISEQAGILPDDKWYTGVVFADVNADGWLDIYVSSSGNMNTGNRKNKLYINNSSSTSTSGGVRHEPSFTESAGSYGLDISAYTTQVSFFDYDMDGDLDCFMINNSPIPVNQLQYSNRRDLPEKEWPVADFLKGGGDHLFRNDGGHFTEVTKQAGIHGSLISFGLGVSIGDINGDDYPDVFVSNDSYERDYLYINQKNGTFKDELENWMQHVSFSSMGADIADINNDGYPDLFTTDMFPLNDYRLKTMGAFDNVDLFNAKLKSGFYYQYPVNSLQLNNKNGMFKDIARYSGVAATDWSWGALFFDMDNDGWNDIYVCNGVNRDVTNLDFMNFFADEVYHKMVLSRKKKEIDLLLKQIPRTPLPNKVYKNNGNLKFTDITSAWGFEQPGFSNGAAYGDLDNDGDLDLVVNNENQPTFVYKNNSREINKNNYIALTLTGKGQNLFAVGSKIKLFANGQIIMRELIPSRGFQSSVDYKIIFGLGKIEKIDSLIITWPDRSYTKLEQPLLNRQHDIQQPEKKSSSSDSQKTVLPTFFTRVSSEFDKHIDNETIDFYSERSVPKTLSREGPKAAVGDVNGDGVDDIFIGGVPGHPGQLYLQTGNGKFIKKNQKAFLEFSDFEDVAVSLFDSDNDNDLDLLICPGGNNVTVNSRELQLRHFKNDGKGNFSLDASAFPNTGMNVSVAAPHDFNNDGYMDLFIGSRSFPGIYGIDPVSYFFMNDGKGHFTNIENAGNEDISKIGMICDAVWADVSGDSLKELIVVGEWITPRIFSYGNGRFKEIKTNLNDMFGWWQAVTVIDANKDGRQDLVLGNIGENFYLNPTHHNPVKLWIQDYDQNKSIEKILTYTIEGKDMPVLLKKDLEDQLPSIKKNNLRHEEYATKSIQELFPKQILQTAIVKKFNYTSSCIAINNGSGNFTIQKLPVMSQLSSVNAIHSMDINKDGYIDLILGGNQFGFLPQFERLDASFGDILLNNGKGEFIWQENIKAGLNMRGEIRDIVEIKRANDRYLLFMQNNDYPFLYKLNN
ncbi:MAG: VCBS repeat-containing protein [Chitinophagaceae bacterium]|nr:VCBS repeat-containing protein [Chitinophagaceae bacterium]